jgi:hypothetical protein
VVVFIVTDVNSKEILGVYKERSDAESHADAVWYQESEIDATVEAWTVR